MNKSYEWNYRYGPLLNGPFPPDPNKPPAYSLLGFRLSSPLGIAAGPLLNSRWIKAYSRLGFDILTYKTVRSYKRKSNPKPNCIFVDSQGPITEDRLGESLTTVLTDPKDIQDITITNSFGVPSRNPLRWQEDVEKAKTYLRSGQVLVVSVMGSSEIYPHRQDFIKDFSNTAQMAKEAGAEIIELDLSCPNSNATEGMVYLDPDLSGSISQAVKSQIGSTPLLIKTGFISDRNLFESVVRANSPHVDGIVGINTLKMKVVNRLQEPALRGRLECGVCGAGIKPCGLQFTRWLVESKKKNKYDFIVIGVGGIMSPSDIDEYMNCGANAVEVATAAMWDPYLAYRYSLSDH